MVDRSGEVHDIRSRNRGLKIAAFVILLLLILVGVAALVYFFFFANNDDYPHLQFKPTPDNGELIMFKASNNEDGEIWAKKIDEFLKVYQDPPTGKKMPCTESYIKWANDSEIPCAIDLSTPAECSSGRDRYGYTNDRGAPCVILKLKQLVGWTPESYTDVEEAEASGMPPELLKYIKDLNTSSVGRVQRTINTTWVTCEGEGPSDKENMGEVRFFFPGFNDASSKYVGIPNMYFPYLEQDAYLDPFLFVKFLRPVRGVLIRVKCTPWAKNIDREDGTLVFELMVDN